MNFLLERVADGGTTDSEDRSRREGLIVCIRGALAVEDGMTVSVDVALSCSGGMGRGDDVGDVLGEELLLSLRPSMSAGQRSRPA